MPYGSIDLNRRNMPPINQSHFAMVPRNDVPRSTFKTTHTHKTTMDFSQLIPIHVDEVLPGDVHHGRMSLFARLSTPVFPIMDNMTIETFFFFVPCRLVWENWVKFMGEQTNPDDSIDYTIPITASPAGGFDPLSIFDYFGLPLEGQMDAGSIKEVNALPLRAYNLILNEWFRDENLMNSLPLNTGDGPDTYTDYNIYPRAKIHDYFTSALPWPQKGGEAVEIPLAGQARINVEGGTTGSILGVWADLDAAERTMAPAGSSPFVVELTTGGSPVHSLYADLTTATGSTINALRQAFAIQQLLERDARGGTRYTELLRNHFGVLPQDARLQRPEYIGGGKTVIQTQAIPQTSSTDATSPQGGLAASALAAGQHEFSYTATEHGYIIGLINARADITYQQGLHRMWTRETRYDFYWPAFANLGEQIIRNDEIYVTGLPADTAAFGYQERWAEYRYRPSRISGMFRSTTANNIDEWTLSDQFTALPVLDGPFIWDHSYAPVARALAAGELANGQQLLVDTMFQISCTRALPIYSVPGLTRL